MNDRVAADQIDDQEADQYRELVITTVNNIMKMVTRDGAIDSGKEVGSRCFAVIELIVATIVAMTVEDTRQAEEAIYKKLIERLRETVPEVRKHMI